ncbi:16S rRNA (adenine(1518)-N(6)/adenine(1519)-N(6))-dimethyltransferase RsmA [Acetobacteraceae bacterium]|nr:16S rRNA (adenine(1518)-N(6)/adenine(1519)-N(6))-dimethyltransferase RsmA [Acetobacteraceae bacterium]
MTTPSYNTDLVAKKSLGQHFLLDPNICDRIAQLGGDLTSQNILEVGPGPAGLTKALLRQGAKKVYAIEIDERTFPFLEEMEATSKGRFTLLKGDALKIDAVTHLKEPRQVIANLPYNVGSPLLVKFLRQAGAWSKMNLMFQLEVAERICAKPNSAAYGRLGVLAQWCGQCDIVMRLPPGAFSPPPKVHSAIVRILPHPNQPSPALFKEMEQITHAAFGQRRKMLRSALKKLGGDQLLEEARIDPTRRGETLSVEEFDRLAKLSLTKKGS